MDIVCDTSSLIKLRKAKALHLLTHLFTTIYIPPSVLKECEARETEICRKIEGGSFIVKKVANILPIGLGTGEREVISFAVDKGVEWVLIDDERAMKKAKKQNLKIIQFFDILLKGKAKGYLTSVKASLDSMKTEGEGIEAKLYQKVVQQAGE